MAFLADQFSIQQSGVATTLVGTMSTKHLDSALAAESTPIDEDLMSIVIAATTNVHTLSWHAA